MSRRLFADNDDYDMRTDDRANIEEELDEDCVGYGLQEDIEAVAQELYDEYARNTAATQKVVDNAFNQALVDLANDVFEARDEFEDLAARVSDDSMPKAPSQSVRWVYTYNLKNESAEQSFKLIEAHMKALYEDGTLRYAIGALEQAPTTGQYHVQGYVEFKVGQKKRLQGVIKVIGLPALGKPHVEGAVATGKQNRVYCLKLNTENPNTRFFEFGQIGKEPGEIMKANFDTTLELAKAGQFDAIAASHQVQYWQNLQKIHFSNHGNLSEDDSFLNFWIFGKPGVGKSRAARDMSGDMPKYFKCSQNKWFDNYAREPVVILDDLEKDAKHQAHLIKMIADRYPCRVEIKGASTMIRPKMIIITSNYTIEDVFDDPAVREAIGRRFRSVELKHYEPHYVQRICKAELAKTTIIDKPTHPFQPTGPTHTPGSAENPIEID